MPMFSHHYFVYPENVGGACFSVFRHGSLVVGTETPMQSGFPLPTGRLTISAVLQRLERFFAGSDAEYNTRARGIGVDRLCTVFQLPAFFAFTGKYAAKVLIKKHGTEKPMQRKGRKPMFQYSSLAYPKSAAAVGGAR